MQRHTGRRREGTRQGEGRDLGREGDVAQQDAVAKVLAEIAFGSLYRSDACARRRLVRVRNRSDRVECGIFNGESIGAGLKPAVKQPNLEILTRIERYARRPFEEMRQEVRVAIDSERHVAVVGWMRNAVRTLRIEEHGGVRIGDRLLTRAFDGIAAAQGDRETRCFVAFLTLVAAARGIADDLADR